MHSAAGSPSDARALASDLAERDDDDLARLFVRRSVAPTVSWSDLFDVAEGLLDPAAVDRALATLPRTDLVALASGDPVGHLVEPALARPDGSVYRAVAERVAAAQSEHPDAFAPVEAEPEPPAASPVEEAAAAERAALSVAALADVLLASLTSPPGRTGAGAVAATDRRRLIDSGAVATPEELDELLDSAAGAGLAVRADREWLVTSRGERWLSAATADRWAAVVDGLAEALPAPLRAFGRIRPTAAWGDAYPLDADWPARADLLVRIAERWGLITPGGAEPSWTTALRADGRVDAASLAALLPPEIDRIYLQADLSAIAPGPLAPALDLRLRSMATRESRAQASTYRFTAESIGAAVGAGETADSIRAFLSALSLTGIPQPLEYLIERTASQHGLIRVQADPAAARTRVESDDAAVLATLLVDQSVRPIGLVRDGDALASRVARDAVYWTLVDARYPVVAVDTAGRPEPLRRRRLAPEVTPATSGSAYERLLGALRGAREADSDAAWLGRELDAAVKARSTIVVVAALPDGSTREFTLEATGMGGGRLRGRDRGSDTERTLPVSSIVSARPA